MIDAAEAIVAEQGLAAMTLRKVQEAAGQANKTAAQYHFGSRTGLIAAIIEERMGRVDTARRRMLDEIDSGERADNLRGLLEAMILPLANHTVGRKDSRYARFLAQTLLDPTLTDIARKHLRLASFLDAHKRMEFAAGGDRAATARVDHTITLMVYTLARFEGAGRDRDEIVSDLIESCLAIIAQPQS